MRPPRLQELVVWQIARLKRTFSDFVENPRYQELVRFFFEDVYSPEDTEERDRQFKALYEFFRKRLGEELTRGVGELVELNDLSHRLDLELLEKIPGKVTDESYEEGYRRCNNYDVRVKQIDMLCRSVRYFRSIAERRTVGLILKTVLTAASLLGGRVVIGFLKRGYNAYRSVTHEEADAFVAALGERERARLDRIYRRPGWQKLPVW